MGMVALALAVALGLAAPAASAGESILVGQSAPLTGPAAAAGGAFVKGARLYLDEVNRAGGIRGRQIELRTLDDAYDPARAGENAKSLIDTGAIGLFGFVNTPASLAGAKVAEARHIPFIAAATGASGLRQPGNDYLFNVRASFKEEVSRIVNHLQTLQLERISFFSLLIPESKVMFDHITGLLARKGQKLFAVANVEPGKVDLVKAAQALRPRESQAVVMFCPGGMCVDLINELRKQGGAGLSFYTISSAGDVFGKLAQEGASIAVTQVMPYPWTPGSPVVGRYQKAMAAAGSAEFGYWSLEGYVAASVLVEGLRRMPGNPSPEALLAGMRSIGRLDLGGYEVTLDRSYHDGSTYTDVTLARPDGKYRR